MLAAIFLRFSGLQWTMHLFEKTERNLLTTRTNIIIMNKHSIRVWRSLVSRLVRVQEAVGSNPATRTIGVSFGVLRFFIENYFVIVVRKRATFCLLPPIGEE